MGTHGGGPTQTHDQTTSATTTAKNPATRMAKLTLGDEERCGGVRGPRGVALEASSVAGHFSLAIRM